MENKFFQDSIYKGRTLNAIKLGTILTLGRFWLRPSGCHTVYSGQDGKFDYDNVQAVMDIGDTTVSIATQDLPPDTIWHYIRRQCSDCGLESGDSPVCVVVINSAGEMIGSTPNAPANLIIEQVVGGKFRLRWRYFITEQEVKPTGFHIYIDSGSGFDFAVPDATAKYRRAVEHNWLSSAYSHGQTCRFVVRSYTADAGEDNNYNIASAVADAQGPQAATGLNISWEEI